MAESTLQRVLDFNEQLNRLSRAGVPIELDEQNVDSEPVAARSSNSGMQNSLQRIENALKLRVELGQPIDDAIDAAPELSPRYRASLKTWLQLADPSAALDPLTTPTRDRQDVIRNVNVALLQPLAIFTLAFLAFLLLCWFTVPRLEALYTQNWITPTGVLAVLLTMRDTLPIWGIAIPMGLLAMCGVWKHQSSRLSIHRLLPGGRRYLQLLCHANFADQVSTLIKNNVPLEQAMLLADPELGAKYIANRDAAPPLLRWALTGDLGGEPLWSVLRFVSLTYRQVGEQYASVWRAVLPTVLGAIVGGVIVFVYGLCLFLPMIDALNMISLPHPS
jgi:type II secretory pathway component PulF